MASCRIFIFKDIFVVQWSHKNWVQTKMSVLWQSLNIPSFFLFSFLFLSFFLPSFCWVSTGVYSNTFTHCLELSVWMFETGTFFHTIKDWFFVLLYFSHIFIDFVKKFHFSWTRLGLGPMSQVAGSNLSWKSQSAFTHSHWHA